MFRRRLLIYLATVVVTVPAISAAVIRILYPAPQTIEEAIQYFLTATHIPGGVVAIGRIGRTPTLYAFGTRRDGSPISTDDVMPVASLSKPVTAAAIMALVHAHKMSLDDRLAGYFPEIAEASDPRYRQITIRQLLNHRSGLFQWPVPDVHSSKADCASTARDYLTLPLESDPGTEYLYSNLGYCWLGMVVARVSGMPYPAFVKQDLHLPFDMALPFFGPFGGWGASAADYFAFATRPLAPEIFDKPASAEGLDFYSLGWRLNDGALRHVGGYQDVFSVVYRKDGLAIVAMFDGSPPNTESAARFLFKYLQRLGQ